MAVGRQGPAELSVTFDDSGGTPRAITDFVMEIGGMKIENRSVRADAFGDIWEEHVYTGKRGAPPIVLSGHFNTTATTGPHVVLQPTAAEVVPNGATRTLAVVVGDSKTFTAECRILDYEVLAENNDLTKFRATVQPTGAPAGGASASFWT